MHEASIALSILDTIIGQCRQQGYQTINSVKLRIGSAAGIFPDALQFAFDIAKNETIAKDAVLIIEQVLLGGICRSCDRRFEIEEYPALSCPHCHGYSLQIDQGFEMNIVEMDVE